MPPLISLVDARSGGWRPGWLEGADVVSQPLTSSAGSDLEVRLWDPSMQLRDARRRARAGTP